MDTVERARLRRIFFKVIAPVYDKCANVVLFGYYNHLRQQVKKKITISAGIRILDIAAGTGYIAEILQPAEVICTDITSEMLRRARVKTDAEFVLAEAHFLPFDDGVFDAVISSFAMHEMSQPGTVFVEMFRVLKPGGDLVVMDVVQQKKLIKKIQYQIFHTWVDQRAANYMKLEELMEAFSEAEDVNLQWEMRELVALVWGKKKCSRG